MVATFQDPNVPPNPLSPYSNSANESRGLGLNAQSNAMQMYGAQAQGLGPSLSGMQLQQGMGDLQRQSVQGMTSGRGGNVAAMQGAGLSAGSGAFGQLNGQLAMQRAAEQQQAQAALAGLGSQVYSQGFGYDQLQNASTMGDMQNQLGWYQSKAGMDMQEELANREFMMNVIKLGIGTGGQVAGAFSQF